MVRKFFLMSALAAAFAAAFAFGASAQSGCTGQFANNTFCGRTSGTTGLPGPVTITPGTLGNIAGGTVIGNPTSSTAAPQATSDPVLGISGSDQGTLGFAGVTSGVVTIKPQSAAGTYNFNLPTGAGTSGQPLLSGGGGSSPMTFGTLSVAGGGTGLVSGTSGAVPYFDSTSTMASSGLLGQNQLLLGGGAGAAPSSLGSLGTTTTVLHGNASGAPTFGAVSLTADVSGILPLANGGTNAGLTASNGGIVYSDASGLAILSGTATAGQIVRSGSSAAPAWSTATYPSTVSANAILFGSSANVIGEVTSAAGAILNTNGSSVPSITPTPTLGVNGGTGGKITLNGATSGSVALQTAAAAGTGTIFQFPANNGTSGYVLQTDGAGVTSWVASASGGTVTSVSFTGGLISVANPTTTPAFTVAGTSGGVPYFSSTSTWASSAALAANALVVGGGAGSAPSTITTGTGIVTALGVATGTDGAPSILIAHGAKALATSAISSATCTAAQTDTATGTATTDAIIASFNGDPTAVTGYVPLTTGMLTIIAYPTANTVNFKVCNNTAASITPGAITINWRVVR